MAITSIIEHEAKENPYPVITTGNINTPSPTPPDVRLPLVTSLHDVAIGYPNNSAKSTWSPVLRFGNGFRSVNSYIPCTNSEDTKTVSVLANTTVSNLDDNQTDPNMVVSEASDPDRDVFQNRFAPFPDLSSNENKKK